MCHEKKYGFHPYALEFSKLIRKGLLSREEAMSKLNLEVQQETLQETLTQLGITQQEIDALPRRAA